MPCKKRVNDSLLEKLLFFGFLTKVECPTLTLTSKVDFGKAIIKFMGLIQVEKRGYPIHIIKEFASLFAHFMAET